MPAAPAGDELDRLAALVFGGEDGRVRFEPLGATFDEAVGTLPRDDPGWERWQVVRSDWALCEAELGGPGDTWARRAARGEVPGVVPADGWAAVAVGTTGLFEVWPGREPWVRDVLRGTAGPLVGEPASPGGADRPLALWELRVAWDERGARALREPLSYPLELLPWLDDRRLASLTGRQGPGLLDLRRGWLRRFRNPRLSVAAAFGL